MIICSRYDILMCVVIKVDRDISKIKILAYVINKYKKLSRMREFFGWVDA